MPVSCLAPFAFGALCSALVVDAEPETAARLHRAFEGRDDIDTCARVRVFAEDDATTVEIVLPDGRSASRSVSRPEDVEATALALLLVPPARDVEDVPPAVRAAEPAFAVVRAEAPARPAETVRPPVSASRVRVELSLSSSGRVGDRMMGAGVGMLSFVEVDRWLAGVTGRADYLQGTSGGDAPGAALTLGLLGGRRFRTTSVALDVYGGPAFANHGTSTSVTDSPATGRIVLEHSPGPLFRALAATRIVFRPDALLRSFVGLDLDIGESADAPDPQMASPAHPMWTVGLSLGATVGSR